MPVYPTRNAALQSRKFGQNTYVLDLTVHILCPASVGAGRTRRAIAPVNVTLREARALFHPLLVEAYSRNQFDGHPTSVNL